MPRSTLRPTIKDVAREARVSHSTVSYVLNKNSHSERISEATKKRIWQAIHQLGYKSNPIGRALQKGYTNQVTLLIVTWHLATSHAATAMSISRAAIGRGLALTVHVADTDEEAEAFLKRSLLHHTGGILVLWDSPAMQNSHLRQLAKEGVPIVDLLPDHPDVTTLPTLDRVTADREDAGYRATQALIEWGHKRIGIICDSGTRVKTTLRKLAGYQRALTSAGLPFDIVLVENIVEFGFEGGYCGFKRLIHRCPELTAIFCINDAIALGVITAAKDGGLNCPDDISVVGFGDSPEGAYWRPQLTTFALSSDEVAEKSIELIITHREDHRKKRENILIPEKFLLRGSTGRAAK